jgi:hypothetical protein
MLVDELAELGLLGHHLPGYVVQLVVVDVGLLLWGCRRVRVVVDGRDINGVVLRTLPFTRRRRIARTRRT